MIEREGKTLLNVKYNKYYNAWLEILEIDGLITFSNQTRKVCHQILKAKLDFV